MGLVFWLLEVLWEISKTWMTLWTCLEAQHRIICVWPRKSKRDYRMMLRQISGMMFKSRYGGLCSTLCFCKDHSKSIYEIQILRWRRKFFSRTFAKTMKLRKYSLNHQCLQWVFGLMPQATSAEVQVALQSLLAHFEASFARGWNNSAPISYDTVPQMECVNEQCAWVSDQRVRLTERPRINLRIVQVTFRYN